MMSGDFTRILMPVFQGLHVSKRHVDEKDMKNEQACGQERHV